jgi:hypothetical protein
MEDGGWRIEDGGWRMEDRGWRMENGEWRMEDRGRRTIVEIISVDLRLRIRNQGSGKQISG